MSNYVGNDMSKKNAFLHLLEHIPDGSENGISMEDLAIEMDLDQRGLRKLVEYARLNGNVIGSNEHGYFIPANYDELLAFHNRCTSRIRTCVRSLAPVRQILRREEDSQLELSNYSLFTSCFDELEDLDSVET